MKAIMISIKPKYVAQILNGKKTIEIRKTCPEIFKHLKPYEGCSIDVYIYCTKDSELDLVDYRGCDMYGDFRLLGHNGKLTTDDKQPRLNGKVVAKFTLNRVEEIKFFEEYVCPNGYEDYDGEWVDTSEIYKNVHDINNETLQKTCLTYNELQNYLGNNNGYAWHISNLVIFDKPKELSEFKHCTEKICIYGKCHKYMHCLKPLTKAPQSMCYIEVE